MGGVLAAAAGGDDSPINDVGIAKNTATDVDVKGQFQKEVAIESLATDGNMIFFSRSFSVFFLFLDFWVF